MKALVLLNMGGARSKDELRTFLINMFNDKNILTMKSDKLRARIACFITNSRLDEAWENYELIGGQSPLHKLTDELVNILQDELDDFFVVTAMRYTEPSSFTAVSQIENLNIKDVVLLPLYPHYSTTTTKSSIDDFVQNAKGKFNIGIIEPFYKNEIFNNAIVDEVLKVQENQEDYYLIFSAHGLPQKIIKNGDHYEEQIQAHMSLLKKKLKNIPVAFNGIHLAYQSKVGPMKWLEPSLDWMLTHFKDKKVIIYPIAFIIDNSETVFELDIEYREISQNLGVKDYKVCSCMNSNKAFLDTIKNLLD